MPISSENETIGAHEGDATAMVTASLTPMITPATSGPSALPSPPSMTAANTTPTQAKICDGASVNVSARQTPASAASAAQPPASSSASQRALTP
jgi:hypothetical protein